MALRGTLTHRKTRRLAMKLGIDPCFALGLMEALWNVGAAQAPAGDIGRLTDDDIAMEILYSGDPAVLIEAMVYAVYLDRHPKHRLIVHDWHIHSDDTTDNKLARAGRCYANGAAPRMRKLSKEERDRLNKLHHFNAASIEQAADPNLRSMDGGEPAKDEETGDPGNGGGPAEGFGQATEVSDESAERPSACARTSTESCKKALPEPVPEPEPEETTPQPPLRGGTVDRIPTHGAGHGAAHRAEHEAGHSSTGNKPFHAKVGGTASGDVALRSEAETAMLECGVSNPRILRVFVDAMRMQQQRERMSPVETRMMMVASWKRWSADAQYMRHTIGPRKFFGEGYWLDEKRWPVDEARVERERRRPDPRVGMQW